MSETLNRANASAPREKPICTAMVSHAPSSRPECHRAVTWGSTAVPVNHSDIASNSATESKKKPVAMRSRDGPQLRWTKASAFMFSVFADCDQMRRVYGVAIDLHVDNLAVLVDQEIHAPADLSFFVIEAVFARDLATQIAEQREGNVDLLRPCFVAEG